MRVFANWRFWVGLVGVAVVFSAGGMALARLLVPPLPDYFRGANFAFALPEGWVSDREGNETVCMPGGDPPHDAIIILATKLRSSDDHREDYEAFISKPRILTLPDGKEVESEVVYARRTVIGGHEWIDALHRNSEIPGYQTRYLVTTTAQVGVAVTFSVSEESFEERNREFEEAIASLEIYQSPSPFN